MMGKHRIAWPPRRERDEAGRRPADPLRAATGRNPVIGLFGPGKSGALPAPERSGHGLRRLAGPTVA